MLLKKPKCERCFRTIAECGFDHWVMCEHGVYSRICCWCVVELDRLGVDRMLLGYNDCPIVEIAASVGGAA